jgi:hypothetical protein
LKVSVPPKVPVVPLVFGPSKKRLKVHSSNADE